MNMPKNYDIPQCYVVVRKLTLEEISRMIISPLFIGHKCGQCKKFAYSAPKCRTCSVSYHYECALKRKNCCGSQILQDEIPNPPQFCPKCKKNVEFGPKCSFCNSRFHSFCLGPFDQCCNFNVLEPPQQQCGKCEKVAMFGPKCPLCKNIYHPQCVEGELECCGIKFTSDDKFSKCSKCPKCRKIVCIGSPMCSLCGEVYHKYCLTSNRNNLCNVKNCHGRRVPLELFMIPSFRHMKIYFKQFTRRRADLKRLEELVANHTRSLRSRTRYEQKEIRSTQKSISCQTCALDSITISDVKTELEQKEIDIHDEPPILEREISYTPEPSSSSISNDSDDSLRNLFDFLYNMVKKFPPQLQTQVKIDLFKAVTEAEMKLQCNMIEGVLTSHSAR